MACAGDNLYIVCGKAGRCKGGGGLYRASIADGSFSRVGDANWQNAACMASDGTYVYIVCGKKDACRGSGGLYKIDPASESYTQLGGPGYEW